MNLPLIKPVLRIAALIVSLIIYAMTVFAAYGGRFNPDFFTLPAIFTLALPFLATLTLVITIGWFLGRRYIAGSLGVLAILCSWSSISSVSPFSFSRKPTPGAQTFKVMTYNIIHAQDQEHRDAPTGNRAIEYIINSGADIVCVQELVKINNQEIRNFTPSLQDSLKKAYPYWVGDKWYEMKVFSKYPIVYEKGYNYVDGDFDPKRYTFYKVNINGRKLTLINVHLSSFMLNAEERNVLTDIKSVKGMKESASELKGDLGDKLTYGFRKRKHDVEILRRTIDHIKGPLIICGDFNDVPESYAYRLLKGEDLKDAYTETGFWPLVTYNQHMFWFGLDHIFYRGPLKALNVERGNLKASDHYPMTAEFEFLPE